MLMKRLALLVLLLISMTAMWPSGAEAVIFFDENLETATVPVDPTKTTIQNLGSSVHGWNGAPAGGWNLGRSYNRNNGEPYDVNLDMCSFQTAVSDETGILAAAGGAHSGSIAWREDYRTIDCDPNYPASGTCNLYDNCGLFRGNDANGPNPSALNSTTDLWIRMWILPSNVVTGSYGVMLPIVGAAKVIYLKNNASETNMLWETYGDNNNTGGPYPNVADQNWQVGVQPRNNLNSTPLQQGVWHCYEWHAKFNTFSGGQWNADGIAEGWVDGTQYMGYYNLQMNGPNVTPGRFDAFNIWRQSALRGSVLFFDDIAAGDQRIGCGGTPPPTQTLTVAKAGTGSGTVTGTGINCGSDCTEAYTTDTTAVLTATPAAGSVFTGWSGDCTGTGICSVVMSFIRSVTALFAAIGIPPSPPGTPHIPADPTDRKALTVTVTGAGTVSGPGLSNCAATSGDCTENIITNTTTTIFANPSSGTIFSGWSGACSGSNTACTIVMNSPKNVAAAFGSTSPTLTVTKSGTGNGLVTSAGGTINCGSACSGTFGLGVQITLTAAADPGSSFLGWSGDCSGTSTCVVTMNDNKNVGAQFSGTVIVFNRYARNNGLTAGTCTNNGISTNGACRLDYALTQVQPGETLGLLDGTYTGAANMLNLESHVPGKSGTSGAKITVQAVNDGQVVIDGQGSNVPVRLSGHSYWSFQGFDVGNSGNVVVYINNPGAISTGLEFKRIVGYNGALGNNHVWSVDDCRSCLFEDIAGFGRGRNILVEGHAENGSVFNRVWLRWDGYPNNGANGPLQASYDGEGGTLIENLITVWAPTNDVSGFVDGVSGWFIRNAPTTFANRIRGTISYATASMASSGVLAGIYANIGVFNPGISVNDIFVDIRTQNNQLGPINVPVGAGTGDRFTGIKLSTQPTSTNQWSLTNFNQCSATLGALGPSLGGCPGFYMGDTPGTGARNCFEYSNGTLTSTKLWPWRMDDRIKAAIARAGSPALSGVALPGVYAAGTPTSEIVGRYGAVPSGCLR